MELHLLSDNNKHIKELLFRIRNKETGIEDFRKLLRELGLFFGYEIANFLIYKNAKCITPMGVEYEGFIHEDAGMLIVSAFEDADYFAAGIGDIFSNVYNGKIKSTRDCDEGDWKATIQHAELPKDLPNIGSVVIAKSVLASGCTAITLIGATLEITKPRNVIVASPIAHETACADIINEYPYVNFKFVIGELDPILDDDGYVLPGLGNVYKRLGI